MARCDIAGADAQGAGGGGARLVWNGIRRPTRPRSWCSWETPKRSAPSITITVALARRSRPRSPSSPPARRSRRRRRRAIASALSVERICPWMKPTVKSRSSPARSRSASTSAARPCGFSDSLDQRADDEGLASLAQLRADELVGVGALAPPRPAASRPACVRPAARAARSCRGRRRRSATASAGSASRSCGGRAAPSPPPPSRRARCAARRRSGAARRRRRAPSRANSHGRLDQRVGADDQAQLAGGEPVQRLAGVAAPASRRSAARTGSPPPPAAARGSSRAARPASRSAPSAPPGGRLRAPAASSRAATTVLPEPTSPISSRCIGSPESRSASISSNASSWSRGRLERQRLEPAPHQLSGLAHPRRRPRRAVAALARRQ